MARDPQRIERILGLLREAWQRNPDQRLTQLLENLSSGLPNGHKGEGDHCLYHIEDDAIERVLEDASPGSRRFRTLLAAERQDVSQLAYNVAVLYDHVSHGRASKPLTDPKVIISLYEEYLTDMVGEAIDEERERILEGMESVNRLWPANPVDAANAMRSEIRRIVKNEQP